MTFAENREILWTRGIPTKEMKYETCIAPQQWSNSNKNNSSILSLEFLTLGYM